MLAGHDSTSSALCFGLWELANNHNFQERLLEEVNPRFKDGSNPTYEQLRHLPFLDACMKEILRLYPTVVLGRTAMKDVTLGNELKQQYLIPAGTMIVMYPWFIHRHPDHWDKPNEFNPDRFLNAAASENETITEGRLKNEHDNKKRPYIPFSISPRYCIGKEIAMAEIRVTLAQIVHRYIITPCNDSDSRDGTPYLRLTIKPVQVKLKFQLREE